MNELVPVLVVVFVVVLVLLSVLQLALVCGAPWGSLAWGGQHRVLPGPLRVGSGVALVLYVAFAVVVLDRAGWIDVLAEPVAVTGTWAVFGFAALSVIPNAVSRSKPERYVGTSAAFLLAAASLVVALSGASTT
ncbi:hypothetical protein [Nonomuraea cavernae]|uniref:Uncharacterized protein n=1 Tax=Nonomuraea cavernae TaxID=2045107 RepID=A0A917ZG61_9ACTN|nr:hypothetical protein [Nonomuraea cavernae]MCA2189999.1 hypothetical protein [Nonomuraea cavernae]GGO81559.1 hypothetical protein GCM10012289_70820 [Nonomuraea cavernae]